MRDINLMALFVASVYIAFTVAGWIDLSTGAPTSPARGTLESVVGAAFAGPLEELIVLAIPVLVLRQARQSFTRIAVLLVLLRLSYHLYYGWPAAGLAIWAMAMVIAYCRTARVLPLIIAHSTYDLLLQFDTSTRHEWHLLASALYGLLILAAFTLGIIAVIRGIGHLRSRRHSFPAGTAPLSPPVGDPNPARTNVNEL